LDLRYGAQDAPDELIENASRAAQIHERIMSFPDKYSTLVGERGVRLSGGERQRGMSMDIPEWRMASTDYIRSIYRKNIVEEPSDPAFGWSMSPVVSGIVLDAMVNNFNFVSLGRSDIVT
jgi:hypothetical protein